MRRLALVAVAIVLAPGAALADGEGFRDGDEQPFCEGPGECPDTDYMDFRRATYGHGRTASQVRHGIRTAERWKTRELGGRHGVTIYFDFNADDDAAVERRLRVRRKHGELRARMFRGKHFDKKVAGFVRAWRPDRRSLKVRFRVRMLGDDLAGYRWQASWYQRGLACPGSCHTDRAPDQGWYEHTL